MVKDGLERDEDLVSGVQDTAWHKWFCIATALVCRIRTW